MPTAPKPPPTARWLRGLALALPVWGLLVIGLYLMRMNAAHDALAATTLTQASGRAEQLAAAKAQQVEALLVGADLALRQFRDKIASGSTAAASAAALSVADAMPAGAVGHFSAADSTGRLVFPSAGMRGARDEPLSVADRRYFRVLAASQGDRLHVNPVVVSHITGQWSLPLSRPVLRQGLTWPEPAGDPQRTGDEQRGLVVR